MNTPKQPNTELVSVVDGVPRASSLDVAARFGKRHDNVLRIIVGLLPDLSEDFHKLNFELMFRDVPIGRGAVRKEPYYALTRDGFSILAMGFTGRAALAWKERYIAAFNRMEAALSPPAASLSAAEARLVSALWPFISPDSRQIIHTMRTLLPDAAPLALISLFGGFQQVRRKRRVRRHHLSTVPKEDTA
jgi:Rha family phage regulatory protein